ncbi:MAG: twin-arginine translocation signal domain-containing protein, partial [Planctomycetaceae bacterium]|nr:twin-arginine translocation signal domain-containing protein [Planctomycetaceae bacterium]
MSHEIFKPDVTRRELLRRAAVGGAAVASATLGFPGALNAAVAAKDDSPGVGQSKSDSWPSFRCTPDQRGIARTTLADQLTQK